MQLQQRIILAIGIFLLYSQAYTQSLSLTVTSQNLALIRETRTVPLHKGKNIQQITDLPGLLDPTSVHIYSKSGDFTVLEQNFEFDLLSADKILAKAIDHKVNVITAEGTAVRGILLSADGGNLVLETENRELRILPRDPGQQILLEEFDQKSYGLITQPTLVWLIDSRKEITPEVEISYLTQGLNWHAEYIASLNGKDTAIDLNAWVSLTNSSGKTYTDTRLKLMAGDLNLAAEEGLYPQEIYMEAMATKAEFREKEFFEYHIYTLDQTTTIRNNQTKQIQLLPTARAAVKKIFNYNYQKSADKVAVLITTMNSQEQGLGLPLPGGKVRVYKQDGADLEFIGEDRIDHTPKDEKIEIEIGQAFDLKAERNVLEQQRISDTAERQKIQIELRNHKNQDIEIQVTEPIFWYRSFEIIKTNYPLKSSDARKIEFTIPVKAAGTSTLVFEILYSW
jgi:hypothetical protein